MLQGLARFAIKIGKEKDFEDALGGRPVLDYYPSVQFFTSDYVDGLDPATFIPGDRIWMNNHRFRPGHDPVGNEGSNVIYLGRNKDGEHLFVHMDRAYTETLDQLRNTVRSYSAAAWQDKEVKNYRCMERFSPRVPDLLK